MALTSLNLLTTSPLSVYTGPGDIGLWVTDAGGSGFECSVQCGSGGGGGGGGGRGRRGRAVWKEVVRLEVRG